MKPEELGTDKYPLRPSALGKLIRCPVQVMLTYGTEDEGGPAAQTGSVVHAAVAAFHLEPDILKKVEAAIAAMHATAPTFPLCDLDETRLYLEPYLTDPRNSKATFVALPHNFRRKDGSILHKGEPAIEVPVTLRLPPHPSDPTGQLITINGTLDQLRDEAGQEIVCDLKTGKTEGWPLLHEHAFQQAAYVLAARQSGFPNAVPGYLIRCMGYRKRGAVLPSPEGVQWWLPFDVRGCELLMDHVRLRVALIRRGEIDFGPGPHCSFCPIGGLGSCIPEADKRFFSLPMAA